MTHACLFELGLLVVTLPGVMYWMNYTLLQALALDLAFVLMVPVYTVFFNGCYDKIFPAPALQSI